MTPKVDIETVDVEATIQSILNRRQTGSAFLNIKEEELRDAIKKDQTFVIKAAKFVQAEIVYKD
ncbi:MAG TPA: hypothetical protein PKI61_00500 [bacterium]|nr:hypothetical protein [bacterium]HPT29518.1 hypothetical protein [bacterium]